MAAQRKYSHADYRIALVSAIKEERLAIDTLFDEQHSQLPQYQEDTNSYCYGKIGLHNVVTASLPRGTYGEDSAASVVTHIRRTFPKLRFMVFVGVGGGCPQKDFDIRLGDVVIASTMFAYDKGKYEAEGKFEFTCPPQYPRDFVANLVTTLESKSARQGPRLSLEISRLAERVKLGFENPAYQQKYGRPPTEDVLFPSDYLHHGESECDMCDASKAINRPARDTRDPHVFFGTVASGNAVMKDALKRDSIKELPMVKKLKDPLLCFEMEAHGAWTGNEANILMIRGVCDYSDSHKHKSFQPYAAATAAAVAKLMLLDLPQLAEDAPSDVSHQRKRRGRDSPVREPSEPKLTRSEFRSLGSLDRDYEHKSVTRRWHAWDPTGFDFQYSVEDYEEDDDAGRLSRSIGSHFSEPPGYAQPVMFSDKLSKSFQGSSEFATLLRQYFTRNSTGEYICFLGDLKEKFTDKQLKRLIALNIPSNGNVVTANIRRSAGS